MVSTSALEGLKPGRYLALDGLRGVAALTVVLYHFENTNHLTDTNAIRHGFLFVDLFFMLSGFVLAASYLERIRSGIELRRFLVLRFFRIYPLHLVTLLAMGAYKLMLWTWAGGSLHVAVTSIKTWSDLVLNLLLIHSLDTTDNLTFNNPSWSVSCEAAGYVVFALATLVGFTQTRFFQLISVPLGIAGYVLVLHVKGTLDTTYDLGIVRCLAGLSLGIWAYRLTTTSVLSISSGVLSVTQIGLLFWVVLALCYIDGVTEFWLMPAFLLILLVLHQDRGVIAKMLYSPVFQLLGAISYSIYMVQFPIMKFMGPVVTRTLPGSYVRNAAGASQFIINPWLGDVLLVFVLVLILAVASLTYRHIEKPWREFGRMLVQRYGPGQRIVL